MQEPAIDVTPKRTRRNLKIIVWLVAVVIATTLFLIAALHFSGWLPVHRWSRIVSFRPAQSADVVNWRIHKRANFSLTYPGNWSMDAENANHDPDHFVVFDAPKRGQFQVQILDEPIDMQSAVDQVVARFDLPLLTSTSKTPFPSWGKYSGHGVNLAGTRLGDPFLVRVFCHANATRSFLIWEYRWDGPLGINSDGFEFIEKNFSFSP